MGNGIGNSRQDAFRLPTGNGGIVFRSKSQCLPMPRADMPDARELTSVVFKYVAFTISLSVKPWCAVQLNAKRRMLVL